MASVFISRRGSDEIAAERLARELRERGHEVWIDTWEIVVGDSIIRKIDAGLRSSSFLLLCGSDAPLDATWIAREWMSALARHLDGAEIKVLPVRLTGSVMPAILADVKYADLVADWQVGVDELCNALG